jgi:AbrB family looped-hinge helix DNA binding protein
MQFIKEVLLVNNNLEYKVEDIFEDDPDNPENVLMTIPPEIREKMGWEPGDVLRIAVEEGSIVLEKVENDKK